MPLAQVVDDICKQVLGPIDAIGGRHGLKASRQSQSVNVLDISTLESTKTLLGPMLDTPRDYVQDRTPAW
jgi:hypothetical protein